MSNQYWAKRVANSQNKLTSKNIRDTEKQLVKYYKRTMESVISSFEATYEKLQNEVEQGRKPTPADLYKLDKYWQLQGQLRQELQRLGDKQSVLFSKNFETHFFDIYHSFAMEGTDAFYTLDVNGARQLLKDIWCADGKNWSQRIWQNTDKLQQALNDSLIECIASGKKTTELKNLLQEQFNVSYNRADALVRTELAHIQTQAAAQRYKDYGIQQVEVFVDEDERTCPICSKHEGERYNVNDVMPVPFHPRCRCCMVPVIE